MESYYFSFCVCPIPFTQHCKILYSFARPSEAKYQELGDLTEMCFPTALEARNLRSRCQQGWFLLRPLSLACR